jgi:myo-inositol-1(or 4)-monophosphatase
MLEFISQVAKEAGILAMEKRKTLSQEAIYTKMTETDLVTDADRAVETFIREKLVAKTSDYSFYGEEFGKSGNSPWCWVIDPIDGTISFVHDQPFWGVSIGLHYEGKPVYGAVYFPRMDELFTAEKGKGAFLNRKQIHTVERENLLECCLATGFSCVRAKRTPDNFEVVPEIVRQVRGFRRTGSAAMDICYLACGRFDGYWELCLAPYDIGAAWLIAEEAGAIMTDLTGGNEFPQKGTLAATPKIHAQLLKYFIAKSIF